MMPNLDHFVSFMKKHGASKDKPVVCYDQSNLMFACRAGWLLHIFGHQEVFILEGGLPKWKSEGRAVESGADASVQEGGDFSYGAPNMAIYRSFENIVDTVKSGNEQIVDVRPEASFAAGSIPTSKSVPAPSLINADGSIKSKEEVESIFKSANVDLAKPIVFSCGGGIMATVAYLICEHRGVKENNLSVYDGSYSEYAARSQQ